LPQPSPQPSPQPPQPSPPPPLPEPDPAPPVAGSESTDGRLGRRANATSDTEGDGATSRDPVETSVYHDSLRGDVSLDEGPIALTPPAGWRFFGQQVDIEAPQGSRRDPLTIKFLLDSSIIPDGLWRKVEVFRDGQLVADCDSGRRRPDPCLDDVDRLRGGDLLLTVDTSHASQWTFGVPASSVAAQTAVKDVVQSPASLPSAGGPPISGANAIPAALILIVSALGLAAAGRVRGPSRWRSS
jgi:hypothetical protein